MSMLAYLTGENPLFTTAFFLVPTGTSSLKCSNHERSHIAHETPPRDVSVLVFPASMGHLTQNAVGTPAYRLSVRSRGYITQIWTGIKSGLGRQCPGLSPLGGWARLQMVGIRFQWLLLLLLTQCSVIQHEGKKRL